LKNQENKNLLRSDEYESEYEYEEEEEEETYEDLERETSLLQEKLRCIREKIRSLHNDRKTNTSSSPRKEFEENQEVTISEEETEEPGESHGEIKEEPPWVRNARLNKPWKDCTIRKLRRI
jgi:predicted ribosome quality control (RQC) complex YloA/Tae2 family protein